jgi:hypothetical protein
MMRRRPRLTKPGPRYYRGGPGLPGRGGCGNAAARLPGRSPARGTAARPAAAAAVPVTRSLPVLGQSRSRRDSAACRGGSQPPAAGRGVTAAVRPVLEDPARAARGPRPRGRPGPAGWWPGRIRCPLRCPGNALRMRPWALLGLKEPGPGSRWQNHDKYGPALPDGPAGTNN